MKRTDQVMKQWAYSGMLSRVTRQTGARAVMQEPEESTLDKVWGLKPSYLPVVLRRNAMGVITRKSDG